jgi:hypothetical protein
MKDDTEYIVWSQIEKQEGDECEVLHHDRIVRRVKTLDEAKELQEQLNNQFYDGFPVNEKDNN